MNPASDNDHDFDPQVRRLHQAALAQVSPQTLMRLRSARHEAQRNAPATGTGTHHRWGWLTATAFSAVLAVGLGLQWLPRTSDAPATATTPASLARADRDVAAEELGVASSALDEDPDLYLWLASADAQPLAME